MRYLIFAISIFSFAQSIDYNDLKNKPTLNPNANDFEFTRTNGSGASGDLSIAGSSKSVTITPCPRGIAGTNTNHYVYISAGTGTAEAVLITGGTCTSGGSTGTIIFTTANTHTGTWKITSATNGIQEAVNYLDLYGNVIIPEGISELYAPIYIGDRISLTGQGMEVTYLHNNSATTSAIRYVAPGISGSNFSGVTFQGFTIYAGTGLSNTLSNSTVAPGVYILDPNMGFTMKDVGIRNHTTAIHQVNGWSTFYANIVIRFYRDYGIYTDRDGNTGSANGADQYLESVSVSNSGVTGSVTDTGCAVRYANWSGIYINNLTTVGAKYGLCINPRAASGVETFTHGYYGTIANSKFDTSEHDGILLDSTNATNGSVTSLYFSNIVSAYNGCVQGDDCTANPFANAGHGIHIKGNQSKAIKFVSGVVRENGGHGVYVEGGNSIHFLGLDADGNSQAADNTYDGYYVAANLSDINIAMCYTGKINTTLGRDPRYGIYIATGTGDDFIISGINFTATNQTGAMFNGSSGAHSVINGNYPTDNYTINDTIHASHVNIVTKTSGSLSGVSSVVDYPVATASATVEKQTFINSVLRAQEQIQRNASTSSADWLLLLADNTAAMNVLGGWRGSTRHFEVPLLTYAQLSNPVNTTGLVYCTNCNTPATPGATCATGGDNAGAEAHYIRGGWRCY